MPTVHLVIKGKVQGVFYRATAKDVADELEIKGWVKNTNEGNVEITASGTEQQLEHFINWCKKGPARAVVAEDLLISIPKITHNLFHLALNEFGIILLAMALNQAIS
jgi:acylphosphatase